MIHRERSKARELWVLSYRLGNMRPNSSHNMLVSFIFVYLFCQIGTKSHCSDRYGKVIVGRLSRILELWARKSIKCSEFNELL